MYYFYVLSSGHDKKCCYGSTKDLKVRFEEHQKGNVGATRHRRPLQLVYYEAYETIENARSREKQVEASGLIRKALHNTLNP